MTNQNDIAVRSAMNNLTKKEEEANIFKKKLKTILQTPISASMRNKYSQSGIHLSNATMMDAINASIVLQALAGNITAYTTIRDTMGYKPVDQVKNDVTVRIDMSPKARELGE